MYQNRIKTLHEYIADAKAVKQNNKVGYYQSLLNQVFETNNLSFTNTFFSKSLIKKRIAMLQKSKSKQIKLLKYALLIPVIFGMLFYVSCEKEVETDLESDTLDIEELTYSFKIGDKNLASIKDEKRYQRYEEFLKANAEEYVSWVEIDYETKTVNFSVHNRDETPPEGSAKLHMNTLKGESYVSYMNFHRAKGYIEGANSINFEEIDDNI